MKIDINRHLPIMQSDNWHSFTGTIIHLSTKYLNIDFKQEDVSLLGSIIILLLSTWQSWAQLLNKQCNTLLLTYANFWYHNLLSFSGFIFMFFFFKILRFPFTYWQANSKIRRIRLKWVFLSCQICHSM